MTEYDHLFAGGLLLLSVMLALGKAPNEADAKRRWGFYRQAWLTGIGMAGLSFLVWHAAGRGLDGFGLKSWAGDRPGLTAAAAVAWAAGLALAVAAIRAGAGRARLEAIYGRYRALMPTSRHELYGSWGAAASAGAGEEIAFRGFLFWYVASLAGPIVALVVTSVLFGIAHGYQRTTGVISASVAGLVLGAIFLASGSLMLVIWMHATYNVASFTVGRIVLDASPGLGRAPVT